MNGSVQQNFPGNFSITLGMNNTGVNYLAGTFMDLVSAYSAGATLSGSTPPADAVTFNSSVLAPSQLEVERAISFRFTNVTPGILQPVNGSLPGFSSNVQGSFSANGTAVTPEPVTVILLVSSLPGLALLRLKRKSA